MESSGIAADVQELTVGALEDEFGLRLNRPRLGIYPLNTGICEPLMKLTSELQSIPWLATRSEYRGDNTYRFTLRPGVVFHDGSRLDANAVKFTLDHTVRVKTQYSFLAPNSVRVVDDSTVDVRPSIPNRRLADQLVHPMYSAIATASDPATLPVCTGPFRFHEYVPQSHITVVRNDAYWGPKAKLDRVTFRFFQDDNTRALALRSGEVDVIFDVNRGTIASLEATPGIKVVASPPGSMILMYIATRGPPPFTRMADQRVRRAVAMAIDRKVLAERVLGGYASVVSTVNPPAVLGRYAATVHGIPYNPAGAGLLLDSAGWRMSAGTVRVKGAERLELVMIMQPGNVDRAVGEYIQAQLAAVGARLRIDNLDAGAFSSRINSGTFDLDIETPSQNDSNPAFLLAVRWYSKATTASARYMPAGPRFDSLVTSALTSESRDDAQRHAAAAMNVLVNEEVAAIPLAGIYRIYAMSDKVRGFDAHPSRNNQWWNTVWLAK
ncbi:MAG: ABC transporter substrate-binding protein [Gemmatimonadaceae bacterium]